MPLFGTKKTGYFNMKNFQILCPISRCGGWVVCIDDGDENFFGCGECGNVWFDKANLDSDIEQITERYSHRKLFYRKENNGYYTTKNLDLNEINRLLETET